MRATDLIYNIALASFTKEAQGLLGPAVTLARQGGKALAHAAPEAAGVAAKGVGHAGVEAGLDEVEGKSFDWGHFGKDVAEGLIPEAVGAGAKGLMYMAPALSSAGGQTMASSLLGPAGFIGGLVAAPVSKRIVGPALGDFAGSLDTISAGPRSMTPAPEPSSRGLSVPGASSNTSGLPWAERAGPATGLPSGPGKVDRSNFNLRDLREPLPSKPAPYRPTYMNATPGYEP